jgi:hypothetical protein
MAEALTIVALSHYARRDRYVKLRGIPLLTNLNAYAGNKTLNCVL